MIAFIWCVLAATSIGVCFKLFTRWNVNALNAIVINYTFCLISGLILDDNVFSPSEVIEKPWFSFSLILGILLMVGFNLIAYSIRYFGITLSVMMQKMSIILTVAFTVIIFKEHFGWIEFIGLCMAAMGIAAINIKNDGHKKIPSKLIWIIPVLILIFSAAVEMLLYYVEKTELTGGRQMQFTTVAFGIAAVIGWIAIASVRMLKKIKFNWIDLLAGVMIGLPNYFSIYLVLILVKTGWEGSLLYPLLNVSVLLLSTLAAILLFKEQLSNVNRLGIGFAIFSILIIAFAKNISGWLTNF